MNKYRTTTCGSQLVDMLEDYSETKRINNITIYNMLTCNYCVEFAKWLEAKNKRRFRELIGYEQR